MHPRLLVLASPLFLVVFGGLLLRVPAPPPPPLEVRAEAGIALWKLKMDDRAGRVFGDVLREDPDNARANFAVGVAAYQTKRFDEAEKRLKIALAKEPDNVEIKLALAVAYQKAKRYNDAVAIYQELRKAHPQDPRFINNLAEVEISRMHYPQARVYVKEYLAMLPQRSPRRKHAEKRLKQLNEQLGDVPQSSPSASPSPKKSK